MRVEHSFNSLFEMRGEVQREAVALHDSCAFNSLFEMLTQ